MRRIAPIVVALTLGACGGENGSTAQGSFALVVGDAPIDLVAPTSLSLQLIVLGAGDRPVTITGESLPSFATLSGSVLTLLPGYGDVGEYDLRLRARAGDATSSAVLRVRVTRGNTGPMWGAMPLVNGSTRADVTGIPVLTATVCDKEGDAITLEVEVTPSGSEPTRIATHARTVSFADVPPLPYYHDESCADFRIPLDGLASGSYEWWLHAVDELGAEDPYGWARLGSFVLH